MKARMQNPAVIIPEAMKAAGELVKAIQRGGVAPSTLELVHLRASQINGCSVCVEGSTRGARKAGVSEEQLLTTAAWRDAPFFSDAERAALALSEAATRISDTADPVPDEIWDEAARHFDERELSAIVLMVGLTNLFNRINVTTRQVAGRQPWERD
ncbi:carboxymuconolactone decarboxylase family protein [Streptomyces sp. NPDC046261]|uniref:carboxymuconolactone decarboxylase family protein n=1 Tax=Streptomyces sp. NPDC046261 TaxID=3157200 RepID=UPI00340360AE